MSILPGVPAHEPSDSIHEIERLSSDSSALVQAATDLQATSPARAALAFLNAGLIARGNGDEATFIECCRRALTADHTYRPAIWALRDLARQKGQWRELAELLRHEFRHGKFGKDEGDRAALLTELAWLELEHLGAGDKAMETLESAFALAPDLPDTALSLLLFPVSNSKSLDPKTVLRIHLTLANQSRGAVRTGWMMSLAWRMPLEDPTQVDEALTHLCAALDEPEIKLDDLRSLIAATDRLSRRSLSGGGDVSSRLRVLEALDARLQRLGSLSPADLATQFALLREQARILRRLEQKNAAADVLLRAQALFGDHPLLREDLRALSLSGAEHLLGEERARSLSAIESVEVALVRADNARTSGANGEAMAELNAIAPDDPLAFLAFLQKLETFVDLNDPLGMAEAFAGEARRREREPFGRSLEDAAHFWVRAGTIHENTLGNLAAAERCYRAAMAVQKDFRPASEGLLSVLSAQARWDDIVEFLSLEMAQSDDPEYTRAVGSALLTINRDVLHDAGAALLSAQRLARLDVSAGSLFRLLEVAVRASGHDREAFETAVAALQALYDRTAQPPVRAALDLVGARFCRRMGAFDRERILLERSLRLDPAGGAAALIESSPRSTPGEKLRALQSELTAVEAENAVERARALRFRIAFTALSQGNPMTSLQMLEPLSLAGDRAASAWMLDIAHREGSARAHRLACAPASGQPLGGKDGAASSRALALGESLERAGHRAEARAAFTRAAAFAETASQRTSAELGRARLAIGDGLPANRTDPAALAEALDGMAAVQEGAAGKNLNDLARVCRLLGGEKEESDRTDAEGIDIVIDEVENSLSGREAGLEWLRFGRMSSGSDVAPRERLLARSRALAAVVERNAARAAVTPPLVAWRLNLHKEILDTGDPERDMAVDGTQGEVIASDLLDLGGRQAQSAFRSRMRRLAFSETGSDRQLAYGLALEYGLDAESHGNRLQATDAYRMALVHEPESMTALAGLARTSEQLGLPSVAANALLALGQRLKTPANRHATLFRAGELFEIAGENQRAAATFAMLLGESPRDARARVALGSVLRKLAQTTGNAAELEAYLGDEIALLSATPNESGSALLANYLERATLRAESSNNAQGAISDLKHALAIAPGCLPALLKLGDLALLDGNGIAALRFLEDAARSVDASGNANTVEYASIQCRISQALFLQKRWGDAISILLTVLRNNPGNALALKRLLDLVSRHPDRESATQTLASAIDRTGTGSLSIRDRTTLLLALADTRLASDDAPQAVEFALRALEGDPLGDAGPWLQNAIGRGVGIDHAAQLRLDRVERSLVSRFAPWLARALHLGEPTGLDWIEFESEATVPELLVRTSMLSRVRGDDGRAGAAEQLSELFRRTAPRDIVTPKVGPFEDTALLAFAGSMGPGTRHLLQLLLADGQAIARSVLDSRRKKMEKFSNAFAQDDVRVSWLRDLGRMVGLDELIVVAGPEESGGLRGDFAANPVLWVPPSLVQETPLSRFWGAQAVVALRFGLPDSLSTEALLTGLAARARIAGISTSLDVPRGVFADLKKRVSRAGRILDADTAGSLAALTEREVALAVAAVARIARIVAHLACGDLSVAVSALARPPSAEIALPDQMFDQPHVRELVIHAFRPIERRGAP